MKINVFIPRIHERMVKKVDFVILLTFAALIALGDDSISEKTGKARFGGHDVVLESGGGDLSDVFKKKFPDSETNAVHRPTDVFLDINGEKLLWEAADRQIDLHLLKSPLNIPPIATKEEIDRIVALTRGKYAEKLASEYTHHALLAQKATEAGISVTDGEVMSMVSNAIKNLNRKFRQEVYSVAQNKESYFYKLQRNYLLTMRYRDTVVRPAISVDPDEIRAHICAISNNIAVAKQYNEQCRVRLEEIRQQIVAGKLSFSKAAEEYSDCGSADEQGVMGEYSYDSELCDVLCNFAKTAPTNTVSHVLESDGGYHLLKVASRNEEDETFVLAQILLEKKNVPSVPDYAGAYRELERRKLGQKIVALQEQAWASSTSKCAVRLDVSRTKKDKKQRYFGGK